MPHVGKYVPWLLKNQVVALDLSIPFYRPPSRKVHMKVNSLGNTGSYPVQWSGQEIISSVGDYDSADTRWTTWTFTNLSNSALTMEFRCFFRTEPPGPTSSIEYLWDTELIARDGSTQVGKYVKVVDYDRMFGRAFQDYNLSGTWPISVGLPVFQNLGLQIWAATWEDQPEYHPYRH